MTAGSTSRADPGRVEFDFYPTPAWQVDMLLDDLPDLSRIAPGAPRCRCDGADILWSVRNGQRVDGPQHEQGCPGDRPVLIDEPCVGSGRIVTAVQARYPETRWHTNDLDPRWPADAHMDAGDRYFSGYQYADELSAFGPRPEWVISNPPFSDAATIVPRALDAATHGVAMLLRISWLEPTDNRGDFLERCPPDRMIVMPRWSYRRNKKLDSVTTVWLIWSPFVTPGIRVRKHKGKQEEMSLE